MLRGVINDVEFDLKTATTVAMSPVWKKGKPKDRVKYLLKTPKNKFFLFCTERIYEYVFVNSLALLSDDQAEFIYDDLPEKKLPKEEVFGKGG